MDYWYGFIVIGPVPINDMPTSPPPPLSTPLKSGHIRIKDGQFAENMKKTISQLLFFVMIALNILKKLY